jgi:serine/threonine protein kinase
MGASPRLEAGRSLAGRFVILRFIASGGMGEVYEALDNELGSRVAVKTILPAFASDPGVVERFRREVLLARRVTHANVCRVFELYSSEPPAGDSLKFLTMEFLDGESLAQRLKRVGRVSPGEALPLLRQMVAALDAAHAQGIVHRDFKPSNVMLVALETRPSGDLPDVRAVVTDFGIARALAVAPGNEGTQTGAVVGTPQYMAPEQMAGGAITAATDIYALGVVMHEMVTGKLPFIGENAPAPAPRGGAPSRRRRLLIRDGVQSSRVAWSVSRNGASRASSTSSQRSTARRPASGVDG